MKNKIIISVFFWCALQACTYKKPERPGGNESYQYPVLRVDTINVFKVGDKFVIGTFENSCCTNCWLSDGVLSNQLYHKNLFEVVDGMTEPDEDNCAGCTIRTETVYQCMNAGKDTLYYAVITNGYVTQFGIHCEDLQLDTLAMEHAGESLISMSRKYVIHILPKQD